MKVTAFFQKVVHGRGLNIFHIIAKLNFFFNPS